MKPKLEFKIATEDWEFKQINELNYKTFVEEIPQHECNEGRLLLDKFHSENTYIICIRERKLLGMMAVRDKRPFSLDNKIKELDSYLPDHNFACEFRLLSIEHDFRNLRIIQGLLIVLAKFADEKGYDIALISANVNRLRFYEQFGFKAFGNEVGTQGARYQPMYLTLKSSLEFRKKSKIMSRVPNNFSIENENLINLLPGPVTLKPEVKKAMMDAPVSHRSEEFRKDFKIVKDQLCELANSKSVEILMGSGSLANDVVAAQLGQIKGKGLILSNGEFGERLIDHGQRMGLNYEEITIAWGDVFDYQELKSFLSNHLDINWLWAVHCETSTGVINDIESLEQICSSLNVRLCLDCVSSLGTQPVDLRNVYLGSGVSGKGLSSYPGLAFVFYNHGISPNPAIPRYLDLGFYAEQNGIPFTMSSNLVYALGQSLYSVDWKTRYSQLDLISLFTRDRINQLGFNIIASDKNSAPAVITISLPQWINSCDLGRDLQDEGILIHWTSKYLVERNWIQIAFMSTQSKKDILPLLNFLSKIKVPHSKAL